MPLVDRQSQTISYNGYSNFSAYTKTLSLTCTPLKDFTGRTVKGNEFRLRIRSVFTGVGAAAEVQKARQALSKNGGVLIVTGLASGDIYVNTNGKTDSDFGPWCEEVTFEPTYGSNLATLVEFTLRWQVPDCQDATYKYRVMEYGFTVDVQIDELGYTTRVINLTARIPNNRATPGSLNTQDSIDYYVEALTPALSPGYRRAYGSRVYNESRSELRWQITDSQLRGPAPPPGVVRHDGGMSFESNGVQGQIWNGRIWYWAEVANGGNISDAIKAFQLFVKYRFNRLSSMLNSGGNGNAVPIPADWSVTEPSIEDRKVEFSITFMVATSLTELLTRSGMWTPTAGFGDWDKWSKSLTKTAFSPRGYANYMLSIDDDKIVDLCSYGGKPVQGIGEVQEKNLRGGIFDPQLPKPNKDNSWVFYTNTIYEEQNSGTVSMVTLPKKALDDTTDRKGTNDALNQPMDGLGGGGGGAEGGGIQFLPPPGGGGGKIINQPVDKGKTTARRVRRPQQFVIMEGRAMRVNFQIPEPVLEAVNGVKLIPANRADRGEGFKTQSKFNNQRDVFYTATWKLRYMVDGDLGETPLPVAPNPLLGN